MTEEQLQAGVCLLHRIRALEGHLAEWQENRAKPETMQTTPPNIEPGSYGRPMRATPSSAVSVTPGAWAKAHAIIVADLEDQLARLRSEYRSL